MKNTGGALRHGLEDNLGYRATRSFRNKDGVKLVILQSAKRTPRSVMVQENGCGGSAYLWISDRKKEEELARLAGVEY